MHQAAQGGDVAGVIVLMLRLRNPERKSVAAFKASPSTPLAPQRTSSPGTPLLRSAQDDKSYLHMRLTELVFAEETTESFSEWVCTVVSLFAAEEVSSRSFDC